MQKLRWSVNEIFKVASVKSVRSILVKVNGPEKQSRFAWILLRWTVFCTIIVGHHEWIHSVSMLSRWPALLATCEWRAEVFVFEDCSRCSSLAKYLLIVIVSGIVIVKTSPPVYWINANDLLNHSNLDTLISIDWFLIRGKFIFLFD